MPEYLGNSFSGGRSMIVPSPLSLAPLTSGTPRISSTRPPAPRAPVNTRLRNSRSGAPCVSLGLKSFASQISRDVHGHRRALSVGDVTYDRPYGAGVRQRTRVPAASPMSAYALAIQRPAGVCLQITDRAARSRDPVDNHVGMGTPDMRREQRPIAKRTGLEDRPQDQETFRQINPPWACVMACLP